MKQKAIALLAGWAEKDADKLISQKTHYPPMLYFFEVQYV